LQHYHKRSLPESTFWMVKAKFSEAIRSKGDMAQVNELLCKVLCHTICVLIQSLYQSLYELGIEPKFWEAVHRTTASHRDARRPYTRTGKASMDTESQRFLQALQAAATVLTRAVATEERRLDHQRFHRHV